MTLSSIPAPHAEAISPFPEHSRMFKICYLSRQPIENPDQCVYFPIHFPAEDIDMLAPVKLSPLFEALGIITIDEQQGFLSSFFGFSSGSKRVLLWRKLSRHRTDLFNTLLSISTIRHH